MDASNGCQVYAGIGVNFGGDFVKGKDKVPETDFVYLEVFPDKKLDKTFKTLVGAKEYENFLDPFQIINEDKDLDGSNAKVFAVCDRYLPFDDRNYYV